MHCRRVHETQNSPPPTHPALWLRPTAPALPCFSCVSSSSAPAALGHCHAPATTAACVRLYDASRMSDAAETVHAHPTAKQPLALALATARLGASTAAPRPPASSCLLQTQQPVPFIDLRAPRALPPPVGSPSPPCMSTCPPCPAPSSLHACCRRPCAGLPSADGSAPPLSTFSLHSMQCAHAQVTPCK